MPNVQPSSQLSVDMSIPRRRSRRSGLRYTIRTSVPMILTARAANQGKVLTFHIVTSVPFDSVQRSEVLIPVLTAQNFRA